MNGLALGQEPGKKKAERLRAWGAGEEACEWTSGSGHKELGSMHSMLIPPESSHGGRGTK